MNNILSIIIPSRNEKYLNKTVESLLSRARGEIEIIEILDGYWTPFIADPRVKIIHFGEAKGMRNGINAGVAIAKGDYILKCDAHVKVARGFDIKIIESIKDKTIIVPRRYRLDAEKWEVIKDGRPPIDRMYLSSDLRGKDWQAGNHPELDIEETPSLQGSLWAMKKSYFKELELLDSDTYRTFWSESQEIGFKCWLSGGRILVNKKTYYAHLHKSERGYSLPDEDKEKARKAVEKWKEGNAWHKQKYPLSWMWEHFPDMPK